MCRIAILALFFFLCTVRAASVLDLTYISKGMIQHRSFEENEVHRATLDDPEKDKAKAIRFVITETIMKTKSIQTESMHTISIITAKDESSPARELHPTLQEQNIEVAYYRAYNKDTDEGRGYAEFTVGSGLEAIRNVVFVPNKPTETAAANKCLCAWAYFE